MEQGVVLSWVSDRPMECSKCHQHEWKTDDIEFEEGQRRTDELDYFSPIRLSVITVRMVASGCMHTHGP